jgi:hypothetical protein
MISIRSSALDAPSLGRIKKRIGNANLHFYKVNLLSHSRLKDCDEIVKECTVGLKLAMQSKELGSYQMNIIGVGLRFLGKDYKNADFYHYAMKAYLISYKYGDDDGLTNAKNVDNDFKQLEGSVNIPDDMMVAVGKLLQLIDEIMQEVGIEVREDGMVPYDQGELHVGIPPGFVQTTNKEKNMFTNDTNEEAKEEEKVTSITDDLQTAIRILRNVDCSEIGHSNIRSGCEQTWNILKKHLVNYDLSNARSINDLR